MGTEYAIRECNEVTGGVCVYGPYDTREAAIEAARDQAKRTKKFVRYDLYDLYPGPTAYNYRALARLRNMLAREVARGE